jgi:TATA-binding protein-associated factor Taf7
MPRRRGVTKELISWRRNQIASMLSRGKSIKDCADFLQVSERLIYEDIRWIRHNSSKMLQRYLSDTLPQELSKCLLRLNQVSNESWAMVDNEKLHAREKLVALARAESSAVSIIELLTNNRELVFAALGRKQQSAVNTNQPSALSQALSEEQEVADIGQQQEEQVELIRAGQESSNELSQEPEEQEEESEEEEEEEEEEEVREDHEFSTENTQRYTTGQDPNRVF